MPENEETIVCNHTIYSTISMSYFILKMSAARKKKKENETDLYNMFKLISSVLYFIFAN